MAGVVGFGGLFFQCDDPEGLAAWYRDTLGLSLNEMGGADFLHSETAERFGPGGRTIWSPFKTGADYFKPSEKPFMMNLIVDDLDGVLERVQAAGVPLEGEPESHPYGRFAWVMDPNGVKVELWEPPTG